MSNEIKTGVILDERVELTLSELCSICNGHAEWIMELVSEGILDPIEHRGTRWVFSGTCVYKVKTATRLKRDLGLNLAGIALALDLMEEMDRMQARLRRLEAQDPD